MIGNGAKMNKPYKKYGKVKTSYTKMTTKRGLKQ